METDFLDVCNLCSDCFPINSLIMEGEQWLCPRCRTPENERRITSPEPGPERKV